MPLMNSNKEIINLRKQSYEKQNHLKRKSFLHNQNFYKIMDIISWITYFTNCKNEKQILTHHCSKFYFKTINYMKHTELLFASHPTSFNDLSLHDNPYIQVLWKPVFHVCSVKSYTFGQKVLCSVTGICNWDTISNLNKK